MSALLIGPDQLAALAALRDFAAARPVDMRRLIMEIVKAQGKTRHRDRMTEQTIEIPFGFLVTFSIETGHPIGTCRHLSMSTGTVGRVPSPESTWMIAEALGFVGGLHDCCGIWLETLEGHGEAVNIVQPIAAVIPRGATIQ